MSSHLVTLSLISLLSFSLLAQPPALEQIDARTRIDGYISYALEHWGLLATGLCVGILTGFAIAMTTRGGAKKEQAAAAAHVAGAAGTVAAGTGAGGTGAGGTGAVGVKPSFDQPPLVSDNALEVENNPRTLQEQFLERQRAGLRRTSGRDSQRLLDETAKPNDAAPAWVKDKGLKPAAKEELDAIESAIKGTQKLQSRSEQQQSDRALLETLIASTAEQLAKAARNHFIWTILPQILHTLTPDKVRAVMAVAFVIPKLNLNEPAPAAALADFEKQLANRLIELVQILGATLSHHEEMGEPGYESLLDKVEAIINARSAAYQAMHPELRVCFRTQEHALARSLMSLLTSLAFRLKDQKARIEKLKTEVVRDYTIDSF